MTIATYNILHGYHKDLILENIRLLIEKGAEVICIQEADPSFEEPLGELFASPKLSGWKVEYVHSGIAGNVALAWDSAKLELQTKEIVLLPTIPPVALQKLKGHTMVLQRAALVGTFRAERRTIRISTVHLAWEGGVSHRLRQLRYLRDTLRGSSTDAEVIAGDFNTFAPSFLRRRQQRKVQQVLGPEYVDALPDLTWTCDMRYSAPQDGSEGLIRLCRFLHLNIRSRLDYLFVRNLEVASAEILDLPGSDHRPLIATVA